MCVYIYVYIYIYIYTCMHERLAENGWKPDRVFLAQKAYRGPRFTGACVKHGGVGFRRTRDVKSTI